ncbi:serine hydrolase domain-containing protein [Rhizobium sp. A22-96]
MSKSSIHDRAMNVLHDLRPEAPLRRRNGVPKSLANVMQRRAIPGVSIAIVDHCEVVWERGFGVRSADRQDEVKPSTLFQTGSISKAVFAMAVMRLVEMGTLDLDEDVNAYLTSWRVPSNGAWTPRITLRHLLSHTAATSVHGFPGYPVSGPVPTLVQVLEGASPANTPPIVVEGIPGLSYRYSGGGTTIAQQVVMDVLGRPFPDLMRELVLDPVGMKNSTYEQPLPPDRAMVAANGHPVNGVPVAGGWHLYPEMAAAGLWTTAGDLARLGAEMLSVLGGGHSLIGLSQETAASMLRPQLPHHRLGGEFAGIGWFCSGQGEPFHFGHGGEDHGFIAQIRMFRASGSGAVVMMNSVRGWPLISQVLSALGSEFGWTSGSGAQAEGSVLDYGSLAGTYRHAGDITARVAFDHGSLTLQIGLLKPVPLVASGERTFSSPVVDIHVSVSQDESRRRPALIIRQFGSELRLEREPLDQSTP